MAQFQSIISNHGCEMKLKKFNYIFEGKVPFLFFIQIYCL